jgi:hypothetical protein
LIVETIVCLVLEGVAGYIKNKTGKMSTSERKITGNDGHNLKCLINVLMNRLGFIFVYAHAAFGANRKARMGILCTLGGVSRFSTFSFLGVKELGS